jgi:hypothetical protein
MLSVNLNLMTETYYLQLIEKSEGKLATLKLLTCQSKLKIILSGFH